MPFYENIAKKLENKSMPSTTKTFRPVASCLYYMDIYITFISDEKCLRFLLNVLIHFLLTFRILKVGCQIHSSLAMIYL